MPYQAYAAFKGLIESSEGYWVRTLKTGHVTDNFLGVKLRGIIDWIYKLRQTHGFEPLKLLPHNPPMKLLLILFMIFLIFWPISELILVISTGYSPIYSLIYLFRGIVNG